MAAGILETNQKQKSSAWQPQTLNEAQSSIHVLMPNRETFPFIKPLCIRSGSTQLYSDGVTREQRSRPKKKEREGCSLAL
jgi:hypothetical protein